MRNRERLSANEQITNTRECLRILVDDGVEQRSGEPQAGDALSLEDTPEILERLERGRKDRQARAVQQRVPDFPSGQIE